MQELVGRLTALDPEASETLKVVAYFDALVASGVGLDGLLRAAAALSGTTAGAQRGSRVIRFDANGRRLGATDDVVPSPERSAGEVRVWLERDGALHANDEMVVERLALAAELLETRRGQDGGLDVALDQQRTVDERSAALSRLRIASHDRIRLIATDVAEPAPGATSTVLPTKYGLLRATVDLSCDLHAKTRVGKGIWARADHAPDSWDAATIAFRLTSDEDPVVDATDLGAMLLLAQAHDPDHPHDDVTRLAACDATQSTVLRALVESESIRSAAAKLGMHHSSVQARHESLTRQLGYDPRTPAGRARYVAAAMLLRL